MRTIGKIAKSGLVLSVLAVLVWGMVVQAAPIPSLRMPKDALQQATPIATGLPTHTAGTALLKMLAIVPYSLAERLDLAVTYADLRALLATRPGAAQPKTLKEWQALQATDSQSAALSMTALRSAWIQLTTQGVALDGMVQSVAIDPFSISGSPPPLKIAHFHVFVASRGS